MDRLWYCQRNGITYVSNSLGALSAVADLALVEDHPYANDRYSTIRTTWGSDSCIRSFPTQSGSANLIWFNNLVYDGHGLLEVEKPDAAPHFETFGDYRDFLCETARGLRRNLESPLRRYKVTPLASVSSGYDSTAAAVVARHAGCDRAVTIRQSASLWRGSDSGEAIAKRLGMSCQSYDRTAGRYPNEAAFWAASGYANLLNWTLFRYPEPVCLFFQGNYGDAIWARRKLPRPFLIDIWDDLAMGECRLFIGLFQCIVPFWGLRHAEEIERITFLEEMEPWALHTDYDRPIPRRIAEEAGVPRGTFAIRKKNSSHEAPFRWPYSHDSQASFRSYLKHRGFCAPGPFLVSLVRGMALVENLVYRNLTMRLGLKRRPRPWLRLEGASLLFHWANDELRQAYQEGLHTPDDRAPSSGDPLLGGVVVRRV